MPVPKLQVISRKISSTLLGWAPLPNNTVSSYKLYVSDSPTGTFTLLKDKLPIAKSKGPIARDLVITYVQDNEIPIIDGNPVYLKLTYVDQNMIESNVSLSEPVKLDFPGVSPMLEGEHGNRNVHLFAWDEASHSWRKLATDDTGALNVNIGSSLSVTLGNVKVAARSDNTTLEYLLVTSDRKLVVSVPNSVSIYEPTSSISEYDFDTIAGGSESTILSYAALVDFKLSKALVSGTASAQFKIKVNGSIVAVRRTNWSERNSDFDFGEKGLDISSGDIIEITAEHNENISHTYDGSIIGFLATVI